MAGNFNSRILLIAGLGNPGDKYAGTRHNAGFMVLDKLLTKLRSSYQEKKLHNAVYYEGQCRGARIILAKPLTFMNNSGEAVRLIAKKNRIEPEEILLIYDDMDLPPGKIRIRQGGGSGGHNGVESVITELGSADFGRIRVGIGKRSDGNQADHVLSEFTEDEKKIFADTLDSAAEAAKLTLYRGLNEAMNRFNTRR